MKKVVISALGSFTLTACIVEESDEVTANIDDLSQNSSSRIATSPIEPGTFGCDAGGVEISMGFDQNENRVLDSDEVVDTYIVCNGVDGQDGSDSFSNLIRVYDEDVGQNCSEGGKRIVVGLDINSNGVLSSNEIQDTQYLCNLEPIAGTGCIVEENQDGSATISCDDGTSVVINDQSGALEYIIQCSGQLDEGFSEVYWEYEGFVFDNEDVMIRAGISDAELEINKTIIYSSKDPNYEEAPITIWLDRYGTSTYGAWELAFKPNTGGVSVAFFDPEAPSGEVSWVANPEDCGVIDYTEM